MSDEDDIMSGDIDSEISELKKSLSGRKAAKAPGGGGSAPADGPLKEYDTYSKPSIGGIAGAISKGLGGAIRGIGGLLGGKQLQESLDDPTDQYLRETQFTSSLDTHKESEARRRAVAKYS